MSWFTWLMLCNAVLIANWARSIKLARDERLALLKKFDNQVSLKYLADALWEMDEVSIGDHAWRCFLFRDRQSLYGPIVQTLMVVPDGTPVEFSDHNWECYQVCFRILNRKRRQMIQYQLAALAAPWQLSLAIASCGFPLPKPNQPKQIMVDAAQEYDDIIAAQELLNG